MRKFTTVALLVGFVSVLLFPSSIKGAEIKYDTTAMVLNYGVRQFQNKLNTCQEHLQINNLNATALSDITIVTVKDLALLKAEVQMPEANGLKVDGFLIERVEDRIYVIGQNENGCLYGVLDCIEQMGSTCELSAIAAKQINPEIAFRAVKINLPWSPYRPGPTNDVHIETCKDLRYWEAFLDMLAKNRFNAVSLWNNHPFPYMIKAHNFPNATPFNDEELAEWKRFFKAIFKMAKERGLETYLINWNIVVSPEFAKNYGAKEYFDRSELVKQYTRESVTQLINEYEDLTGFGTTLADWMGNWGEEKMTPEEREDWIKETIVEGIKNADREVKFIHRAVLSGDPKLMREVIDYADLAQKTIVEIKFNWSHGHSTPKLSLTHANDDGTIMRGFWDPKPENFFIAYMVRNEDFFVLRWGDPGFIRDHIAMNKQDYVQGYFIGSEGYIPAQDYSHITPHPQKTWDYAFEKQWLYYHLWGRLLYNPKESDAVLAQEIQQRHDELDAVKYLKASSLVSQVPLHIATFIKGTWDFTLYSEGFLMPWEYDIGGDTSPFISIEELIRYKTLSTDYLNIEDYCTQFLKGQLDADKITPVALAQQIVQECDSATVLLAELENMSGDLTFQSEIADMKAWNALGFYFSEKIKAGVAFRFYQLSGAPGKKELAILHAQNALKHWQELVSLTEDRYQEMPYVMMDHPENRWPDFKGFHWKNYLDEVKADIEHIKGTVVDAQEIMDK